MGMSNFMKTLFKIILELIELFLIALGAMVVIIISGIFIISLFIRDQYYKLIRKKRNYNE